MGLFKLKNNAEIELVTPAEQRAMLDKQTRDWWEEKSRGVQPARFTGYGTINTGAVTLPATGDNPIGPRPGYAWAVYRISVRGLATNDVLNVFRSNGLTATDENYIGQLTAAAPALYIGKGLILRGPEKLIITGTSLSATAVTVNGEAQEVPDVDVNKLY